MADVEDPTKQAVGAAGVTSEKNTGLNYFLEGDAETKRLEQQHPVVKVAMGGRLVLAPIDFTRHDMRILDSGTSDGTWLLDFRKDIAHGDRKHTFVGMDLDGNRFPKNLPADVNLVEHNVLDPWPESWVESFDLFHQRLVIVAAGSETRSLLRRELQLVKPGGWIQLIEAENICAADDGPAMRQFLSLITEIFEKLGCGVDFPRKLRPWLEEAGFENTGECLIPYTFGTKCTAPELREQSIVSASVAIGGLVEYGKTFGQDLKCLSSDDLDTLVPRFKEEMKKQGAYYPLRVVWGQKPSTPSAPQDEA